MMLYYDGSSHFCSFWFLLFQRLGLMSQVQLTAVDPGQQASQLVPDFNGPSQLVDPHTGTLYEGFAVPAELLRRRFTWLKLLPLMRLPGLRQFFGWLHLLVFINRDMLLPDPRGQRSVYGPSPSLASDLQLVLVLLFGAVGGSLLFGAAIGSHQAQFDLLQTGLHLAIAAGAGWAQAITVIALLMRRNLRAFVLQNLMVMNIGIFWLLPTTAVLLVALPFHPNQLILALIICAGVLVDAALMARSFFARSRALGFPVWVAPLWFVLLQLGGLPLLLKFDLLNPEALCFL